jgi:predicted MFS family arabinose efflux permease
MAAIGTFFGWLFGTRQGVITLVVGGLVLFLIIAFVLERRTRAMYKNHAKSEDDWDLFDDEDGWSEFEGDNN